MLSVEYFLTFLHTLLRNFGTQILIRDLAWRSVFLRNTICRYLVFPRVLINVVLLQARRLEELKEYHHNPSFQGILTQYRKGAACLLAAVCWNK